MPQNTEAKKRQCGLMERVLTVGSYILTMESYILTMESYILLLISFVTLGNLLEHSELQFSHL